jgi:hypothetical protein
MTIRYLYSTAMAGIFFGMTVMAQTTPIANEETITTGMVGFTSGQTARLNVLNLNTAPVASPVSTASAVGYCTIEMEFFDSKNALLAHSGNITIAPQTATSLDQSWVPSITPSPVASAAESVRREIRGVVIMIPTPSAGSPVATGACNVKITLEVFDANGSTISLTSDTSTITTGVLTPAVK